MQLSLLRMRINIEWNINFFNISNFSVTFNGRRSAEYLFFLSEETSKFANFGCDLGGKEDHLQCSQGLKKIVKYSAPTPNELQFG